MKIALWIMGFFLASTALAEQHKTVQWDVANVKPGQRIEIDGISGSDIVFRSWPKQEVSIKLYVSISSSDAEYEKEYIRNAEIRQEDIGNRSRFTFREVSSSGSGSIISRFFGGYYINKNISGEIYVPQSNPLETDMRYGKLSLEDMKGELELLGTTNTLSLRNCSALKQVDNNYGTTTITSCGGDLSLNGTSSTITITGLDGSVRINADYSNLDVAKVSGNAVITDKSGKVSLNGAGGNVRMDVDYSTVTMSDVKGYVNVRCTSGSIRATNIDGIDADAKYSTVEVTGMKNHLGKPIAIRSASGKLDLEDVTGDVKIDNPYSNIFLSRITGHVELSTTSGQVEADAITGDWSSRTQYSTITIRRLTAKNITMTNSSNSIDVALLSVPSTVDIHNQYGSVRVRMPAGFSGNVELSADYGSVETNLPVKVKEMSSSGYATGKVGAGSGTITVETKSANVSVMEER